MIVTLLNGLLRVGAAVLVPFAAVVAFVALPGCSALFGDKPEEPRAMAVKDDSLACMIRIGDDVRSWSENEKTDLAASVDCAIRALSKFKERTKGESATGWSQEELTSFVSTYFNKDSEKWMDDALKIKQILIGGRDDRLSHKEVNRIKGFLERIKGVLPRVSAHGAVLLLRADEAKPEDADAAADGLEAIAAALAQELGSAEAGQAPLLLSKVEEMVQDFGGNPDGVRSLVPLAESFKAIVIGGEKNRIAPSEWPRLITSMARLWAIAVRFRYQVLLTQGGVESFGKDLPRAQAILEKAAQALDDAVDAQGAAGMVANERIEDLLAELGKRKLFPRGVTLKTLKNQLPIVFGKLLHGNSQEDRLAKSKGLSHSHVRVLREVARDWLEGQKLIVSAFERASERDADGLARAFHVPGASEENLLAKRARVQLLDLVERGRPLARDGEGRLLVIRRSRTPGLSRGDLDALNITRVGIALVLRGYAHDKQAALETRGLTEAEAQEVYLDWREVGLEMRAVDARVRNAGYRTFMEANLFTSVANGDDRMELHESVEWLYIVLAGGKLADRVQASMVEECGLETRDVFGRRKLKSDCFRQRFRSDFTSLFTNLPGFVAWYNDPAEREERSKQVLEALEEAGRTMGVSAHGVDSSELRGIVPILHYAENLMVVHDKNDNEMLDAEELWNFFPLIQPFIRKMTKGATDRPFVHEAIFSWILSFGSAPQPDAWGGAKLLGWAGARHLFSEKATRLDIIKIMSSLAAAGRQERVKRVSQYLDERSSNLKAEMVSGDERVALEIGEIYQCLEEVTPVLRRQLQSHAENLLPNEAKGSDRAQIFVRTLRDVILSAPALSLNCLPF